MKWGYAITLKIVTWEIGWFGGSQDCKFKIVKCEIGLSGIVLNIELSIL